MPPVNTRKTKDQLADQPTNQPTNHPYTRLKRSTASRNILFLAYQDYFLPDNRGNDFWEKIIDIKNKSLQSWSEINVARIWRSPILLLFYSYLPPQDLNVLIFRLLRWAPTLTRFIDTLPYFNMVQIWKLPNLLLSYSWRSPHHHPGLPFTSFPLLLHIHSTPLSFISLALPSAACFALLFSLVHATL